MDNRITPVFHLTDTRYGHIEFLFSINPYTASTRQVNLYLIGNQVHQVEISRAREV